MKVRQLEKKQRAKLLRNINLYPVKMDLRVDKLLFIEVNAQELIDASFHDSRVLLRHDSICYETSIDGLMAYFERYLGVNPPIRAVYHNAFCGSTLLSRYLGELNKYFIYREPPVFSHLANYKYLGMAEKNDELWRKLLCLSSCLMSRSPKGLSAITKMNDNCNNLIVDIHRFNEKSKSLILYSDLETFLISILKDSERRRFVRDRLSFMGSSSFPALKEVNHSELSDAHAAAFLWLLQTHIMIDAIDKYDRIRTLNCNQLFDNPNQALLETVQFFGKDVDENLFEEAIIKHGTNHSKLGHVYSSSVRQEKLSRLRENYTEEVDSGLEWADGFIDPGFLLPILGARLL